MIFFRVSENINIKTTDGTLINYFKFKEPSKLENETVYITTYKDYQDLKDIFYKVDKDKYFTKILNEKNIRNLEKFPIELGISNIDEYYNRETLSNQINWHNTKKVDIYKQLKNIQKDEISVAIIGGLGIGIGETFSSCTALRILYKKLKEIYKNVRFDIFINASSNNFYSREKEIYQTQDFINNIYPLSISSKKLFEYDYYIDNSLFIESVELELLNYVDAWLFKFGLDYEKIPDSEKYNQINISNYKVSESLKKRISDAKLKGKLLLYHPYSANIDK